MFKRIRLVSEAYEVVRPVSVYLVAIGVLAYTMATAGGRVHCAILGFGIVCIASAMILQVRRAVRDLRRQSRDARRAAAEAERHYAEMLRRIITFVEGREKFRRGHSENVGRLAGSIGRQMGLPEETCELLILGGRLHDIGLVAVPDACRNGYNRFGVEEFRSIQKHSEVSYEVLKPLEMLADVLPAIRTHHERMNGTGYPAGLAGEEIPLGGRIFAVADAYDAMTHDRPHREAVSPLQAMRELRRCSPAGYDPACVEALAEVMNIPVLEEATAARQCCAV